MTRARNRNKPNATGRNPTGRFVQLRYPLLESLAFRSLSPNARALLVELIMLHNGDNNGSIYMALQDAAARMGVADPHTAAGAFGELQERGFITMTRDAHFKVKAADRSRARTWRLNHLPGPGRRVADWEFLDRQPSAKTRASKRADRGCRALKRYRKARDADKFPGVEFSHGDADLPEAKQDAVRNFHTGMTDNCGTGADDGLGYSHTYIANQGGLGANLAEANKSTTGPADCGDPTLLVGWWQPDRSEALARLAMVTCLVRQLRKAIDEKKLAA